MKKVISRVLVLAMFVTLLQTSAFAAAGNATNCDQINQQISDTGVTFLYISDTKVVYTYEKGGETYKYIETVNSNVVESEIYLLVDDDYQYVKTLVTVIDIPKMAGISRIDGPTGSTASPAAYQYDWVFVSKTEGDTSVENKTILNIANSLAILIGVIPGGGIPSAILGIATNVFDLGLKTVYYTLYTYKDANNPSTLRPTYKYVAYLYSDANRTKELDKSPITRIVDGG